MSKKMCMGLFSGSIDKLTAAGVILSGAAAEDMEVDVFVLLMGAYAFKKENAGKLDSVAELPHLKEQLFASLQRLKVSTWMEFFKEAKELTKVKIHICGLAGKLWGGEKIEDFVDFADDICGISEYISAAEEADIHLFI
jgi:peroxiredoxin family protein